MNSAQAFAEGYFEALEKCASTSQDTLSGKELLGRALAGATLGGLSLGVPAYLLTDSLGAGLASGFTGASVGGGLALASSLPEGSSGFYYSSDPNDPWLAAHRDRRASPK